MLNLAGQFEVQSIKVINDIVSTHFVDSSIFKTPESLVLYEQGYLDKEPLLELCNKEYEEELTEPKGTFVPKDIIEAFRFTDSVPIRFLPSQKTIEVIYIPEYPFSKISYKSYKVKYVPTTLHYFVFCYTELYGTFKEILPITGLDALRMIFEEAIKLNIPDLTISNIGNRLIVYYNRNKRKVITKNIFSYETLEEIIRVLTAASPIADFTSRKPKYVGYKIDDDYRSRVIINKTIEGYAITSRIFPQADFEKTMEMLNLNSELISSFRDSSINRKSGLRLVVGDTMSGKNTTILSVIKEYIDKGEDKVVSIEMPVEQRVHGMEQIDVDSVEDYVLNCESLIHQNPGVVYITEMRDETGKSVIKIANTGKRVFSTVHSNSVADTISRLCDITGYSVNRIIQVLHTIVYQELVPIDDTMYPNTKFVHFDDEFKLQLYDKPFGEVIRLIRERERGGFGDVLLQR